MSSGAVFVHAAQQCVAIEINEFLIDIPQGPESGGNDGVYGIERPLLHESLCKGVVPTGKGNGCSDDHEKMQHIFTPDATPLL